jgi:hypothetical protein
MLDRYISKRDQTVGIHISNSSGVGGGGAVAMDIVAIATDIHLSNI